MKKKLILASVFVFSTVAISTQKFVHIEVGSSKDASKAYLHRRIELLEQAVIELQSRILTLEGTHGALPEFTCYIQTTFDGVIKATRPTLTDAKASTLELCVQKTNGGHDCKEKKLSCGD